MPPVSESADVVICGGAAIGSSVAYHLAADPGFTGKVVVIEKDPTYRFSASALSAASACPRGPLSVLVWAGPAARRPRRRPRRRRGLACSPSDTQAIVAGTGGALSHTRRA